MDELVAAGDDRPLGWGPARYFQFPNAQGTVGFISPLSRHFCSECNRLRLTADGKLRPCLFSDDEYDLRTALRSGDEQSARTVFAQALGAKPRRAPRQGRNRAGNVPNWRLRGTDGLPADGTCRCCEGPRRAAFARSQGLAYQSTLRPCDPPNSTPLGPSR